MTSEPEKLLPVIQADRDLRDAVIALDWPGNHAAYEAELDQIIAKHRLSSPVSGTDMVMVPREPTQAMREAATEVRVDDGRGGFTALNWEEADAVYAAILSASPTPPIPMIAEAGERDRLKDAIWELLSHRGERPGRVLRGGQELWETWVPAFEAAMRYLPSSTPATLANTAVEVAREALGTAQEWIDKRDQLLDWTSSAWLAGEEQQKPPEGIGAFLSSLIGWLMAGEEAAAALATLTAKTEKADTPTQVNEGGR